MATTQQNIGIGRDAIDRATDATAKAGNDAAEVMKSAGRKATEVVEHAGEIAHEHLDSMTAYVRKNPLQATAIAVGVGFVFALIARR